MSVQNSIQGLTYWLRLGIRLARPGGTAVAHTTAGASILRWAHAAPHQSAEVGRGPSKVRADRYGVDQIQVLEGLEPVRKRPGMYIGSTGQRGLHHLVFEVLDNSVDEVQAGYCTDIRVQLNLSDSSVCITDNGRGIPTDIHPQTGKSALETVLTVLHAGGKFGGGLSGYSVSGGLHGVGVSVVNALSESLEIVVWRDGSKHMQSFARGEPVGHMKVTPLDNSEKHKTGTQVKFRHDKTIFSSNAGIDPNTIQSRLRELAFLNSEASLHFQVMGSPENVNGSAGGECHTFHYEGGLKEYVQWVNRDRKPLHDPIYFSRERSGVQVNVALQWCSDAFSDTLLGYANSIKTIDGGTHLDGLKTSLTRTLNSLARKNKMLKEGDPNLAGDFLREGLGAVVSVKMESPEFEGQTKTRLGNPGIRRIVDSVVSEDVSVALERDPETLSLIMGKAIQAYKAAEAAKKARELVRRKNVLTKSTLPGKLADCSRQGDRETEIFLVEGDSAGGTAKQARDRAFQAVLPLRGKILNAERKDDASVYKNKEVTSMIVALGLEKKPDNKDLSSLRYDRIIILTDADVDGAHIRTLLLTFLFRFQRSLFDQGKVYVAVPPLYKLQSGKKQQYCFSEAELKQATRRKTSASVVVQRFKGLGEMMPEQLWHTTLNPETRILRRLTIEDAAEASHMFALLMGKDVEPRRELIEREGRQLGFSDLDI